MTQDTMFFGGYYLFFFSFKNKILWGELGKESLPKELRGKYVDLLEKKRKQSCSWKKTNSNFSILPQQNQKGAERGIVLWGKLEVG